jgi:hypothetical protein
MICSMKGADSEKEKWSTCLQMGNGSVYTNGVQSWVWWNGWISSALFCTRAYTLQYIVSFIYPSLIMLAFPIRDFYTAILD